MKKYFLIPAVALIMITVFSSCKEGASTNNKKSSDSTVVDPNRFADLRVLQYQVPGFENLKLQQKKLCYYLYMAALSGRDICYDQKYKWNLTVRKTIEAILNSYKGDTTATDWKNFITYSKRVFFSNGIHHHYSSMKFVPDFKFDYFKSLLKAADQKSLPLGEGQTVEAFAEMLNPVMFDINFEPKHINQDPNVDMVVNSANNFYEGVTQKEVEDFYSKIPNDKKHPVELGLNSKLIKENGKIVEKTWKVGGMYTAAIEKMVYWLNKAIEVAENDKQKTALQLLVKYYHTGDLKDWDAYNIAWTNDKESMVDISNGFIEVYGDPLGKRGTYESVVSIRDVEGSKVIGTIGKNAQWFEDNSPLMPEHKKKNVVGIDGKSINVVIESGDAAPYTPIGINLPNNDWVRKEHGSKSVSLANIVAAYNLASAKGKDVDEFAPDTIVGSRIKKWGAVASMLHTDMHEVIGHASGQINEGVGTPDQTEKQYASTLEEARADLVGLYYVMDKKLIEIGVMPSLEVGKAEYDQYIMNGLITQLNRIELGNNLEEAHMKNRQLNALWAYEMGKKENVIEKIRRDGKTYFKVNDYEKLRNLFGQLLREIQRIKSEGDFAAGQKLVETYGVKVDQALLKEVKDRFKPLNVAPYKGFIQPKLIAITDKDGNITDVKVEYTNDFLGQMLGYGKEFGLLPVRN